METQRKGVWWKNDDELLSGQVASSIGLWVDLFGELKKLVFLKARDFPFCHQRESSRLNFINESLFARSNMAEQPLTRNAGNPLEVNDDNSTATSQRAVNRRHRFYRVFKMMVNIADKGEVNAIGR